MTTPFPFQSAAVLLASQLNAITSLPISTKTASYVALVGDVGSRLIMNVATANTLTINNSVFAESDTIFIANKGAGTTTITAGAGVTINGTLTVAQHGGGTLVALSASVFTFFSGAGSLYGTATGGNTSGPITVSGQAYTLETFTSDGTLTVTKSGLFDYYIVAGAGSGGCGQSNVSGAGGGAGGVLTGTAYFSANQTIDIGAGGSGSATVAAATNGLASVVGTGTGALSAAGGGRGAGGATGGSTFAGNGASGGGSTYAGSDPMQPGVSVANTIQGYAGGTGSASVNVGGAAGGGATAIGANNSGTTGGAGGAGVDVSTFIGAGSPLYKAGGGGGGGLVGGAGGSSVGGAGGSQVAGVSASANTGGGGGGCGYGVGASTAGGNGASGIIYIRFKV